MESAVLRAACMSLVIAAALSQGGCRALSGLWRRPPPPAPCTFNPGATPTEVVAHVNRNVSPVDGTPPLTSWRSLQVTMKMRGMPQVNASVSVEAPRRLRIQAAMPFTNADVADIGSNDEEIWYWDRYTEGIITVGHEDLPYALARMQIPFEPEWLMEVLGITALNAEDFELVRPVTEAGYLELVADRESPTGQPVRRIVRIDACYGRISEHRLETPEGALIAIASLGEYREDASGQYMLPHLIHLRWPATQTELTMHITGRIQTNPPPASETAWDVPSKPGVPRRIGPPAGSRRPRSMEQPVLRQTAPPPAWADDSRGAFEAE